MTVPATTFGLIGDDPASRASADEVFKLAPGDDFARWEAQLAATEERTLATLTPHRGWTGTLCATG